MEQHNKTNSFKKLLDRLQEDSWQLELLISGFAIFGLFYAIEPIALKVSNTQHNNNDIFFISYAVVYASIHIFLFNLLLHVLLRGLWIGSLGLRYVFGEIDFDKLNYSDLFSKYLKNKVGSFDTYIGKLEDICSFIFAITFLLVFYVISICILVLTLSIISWIPDWAEIAIKIPLYTFFSIGTILTFVDFITQGLVKKNRWVAKVFFPFYVVFSFMTLSFLYRPLVYNLLDNNYGKRISFILIPFYLLVYALANLGYQNSNFITKDNTETSNSRVANKNNYEDDLKDRKGLHIDEFAIQSKVITKPYIKVFVPLNDKIEDSLIELNSNLKSKEDKRGLSFGSTFTISVRSTGSETELNYDSLQTVFLTTFEKYYSFKIDTTAFKTDFTISTANNELGFESYIGVKGLSEGKHTIEFQSLPQNDTSSLVSIRTVPFWYYNN